MLHNLEMAASWQRQSEYFHRMSTRDFGLSSRIYFQQMAAEAAKTAREFRDACPREFQSVTAA